jgi:hypothetical protein
MKKAIRSEKASLPVYYLPTAWLEHHFTVMLVLRSFLIVGAPQNLDICEPVNETGPPCKKQEGQ